MSMIELRKRMKEEHRLMMRILEIIEYANLDELEKLNQWLEENGLAKKELFVWPLGYYFKAVGGVPVDRKNKENKVDTIAKLFEDKEEFKSIIDNVYDGLNKDYRETRIADYKSDGDNFSIFGIIKSESDQLDLFTMKLRGVDNGFELISFNF